MSQHYSNPTRASDPHALPDVETFYHVALRQDQFGPWRHVLRTGWYWQQRHGGFVGPFATEAEALADAASATQPCSRCGHCCPAETNDCPKCGSDVMQPGFTLCVDCDADERDADAQRGEE